MEGTWALKVEKSHSNLASARDLIGVSNTTRQPTTTPTNK